MSTKRVAVAVIGASHAGLGISHRLLRQIPNLSLTLVNPSDEYYFNIAAPRLLVKPDSLSPNQYLYSIPDSFREYSSGSFNFVKGLVTAIDPENKSISVAGNNNALTNPDIKLLYDYLVIASGSTTPATMGHIGLKIPFKAHGFEDTRTVIRDAQEKLQTAKTVVIGGGGPLGVELAGELSEAESLRKKIILVSQSDLLLSGATESVSKTAESLLHAKNVEILKPATVDKVDHDQTRKIVTLSTGRQINADAYISTTGVIPNSQFIPKRFLSKQGWVNVDEYFMVKEDGVSRRDIYAIGDITSHPYRLLSRIPAQASTVAANLATSILESGTPVSYSAESQRNMMVVPVGESTGTGHVGRWKLLGCLVWYFKGKDFLVYKAPKFLKGVAE